MGIAGFPRIWRLRGSRGDGMDICGVPAGRISCHNLNLVLSHGLSLDKSAAANNDKEDEPSGAPAEVVQLINICEEIVTLANWTKINTKLDNTLKQCVVTRWNSTLTTMKSVAENVQDLHTISTEAGVNRNLLYDYWQTSMSICWQTSSLFLRLSTRQPTQLTSHHPCWLLTSQLTSPTNKIATVKTSVSFGVTLA